MTEFARSAVSPVITSGNVKLASVSNVRKYANTKSGLLKILTQIVRSMNVGIARDAVTFLAPKNFWIRL